MKKVCTKCKRKLDLDMFSMASGTKKNKDGLRPRCKTCTKIDKKNYRQTKKGLSSTLYDHHIFRSKEHSMPFPKYSKKDLREWLFSQKEFHHLFQLWENSNFDKMLTPSVDRKNDYLPYNFSNIQLMSWQDNLYKGHRDVVNGINNKRSKSVKQFSNDGKLIDIFFSIADASRKTGISKSCICNVCQGKEKTAKGFKFEYTEVKI